jgi:8-oxo-dGTP pyrophosphatase MutT (NUDIX family)
MIFSRKIYYNDKPMVLTTNHEAYLETYPVAEMYQFFSGATPRNFQQALNMLDNPGSRGAIIEDISEANMLAQLESMYQPIMAGGGLVFNEHGALLMIFRRGKWDLPKGKLDEGEDIATCALREVTEETGLDNIQLNGHLCDSYHIYTQDDGQYLKQTVWYKMIGTSDEKLKPQKEENILEARWVSEKEMSQFVGRTYEAIREVLKTAGCRW